MDRIRRNHAADARSRIHLTVAADDRTRIQNTVAADLDKVAQHRADLFAAGGDLFVLALNQGLTALPPILFIALSIHS